MNEVALNYKYDLHCHSHYSDGKLSPADLIDYAAVRDISYLALSDHDCIDGIAEAQAHISHIKSSMQLINALEISAMTEFGEIHIVGLGVDVDNEQLNSALVDQQQKRWLRAETICAGLTKAGVIGVFELCQQSVKNVITRTHIAQAIVTLEYAKDMQQAFKKYIGKNARIKIPKDWVTMQQAIQLIREAGGMAVLAHPTRYPLSTRKLGYLIKQFAESGGDALELAYPSLTADKTAWLMQQLEAYQLMASSGSDFHYPDLRWTDLGRFPNLDPKIPHVMQKLIGRC